MADSQSTASADNSENAKTTKSNPIASLVYIRFPLLALLFLLIWSPVSVWASFARPIAANILLVETWQQVVVLTAINVLATVSTIAILRVLCRRVKLKFDPNFKTLPWTWKHFGVATIVSLCCPISVVLYSSSQSTGDFPTILMWLGILFGVAVGVAVLWGFGKARSLAFGSVEDDNNYFPFENRTNNISKREFAKSLKTGWLEPQLVLYFAILFISYFAILRPAEPHLGSYLAVPTYMVLLCWIAAMALPGISSVLDRAHFPTTVVLIIVVAFARGCSHYENTFPVFASSAPTPQVVQDFASYSLAMQAYSDDSSEDAKARLQLLEKQRTVIEDVAWNAIENRLINLPVTSEHGATLVIVTCPGGGIHATAWTSYVLEKLDQRYENFSDSICVISSVSGGSVGTLFFVKNRYDLPGTLDGNTWRNSVESALNPIATGLALEDLPATFLPFLVSGENDRGVRLENLWRNRLGAASELQTLNNWAEKAAEGRMPIVIFNATDAATGRRVLFSSVPLPYRSSMLNRLGRPWDIRELIDPTKHDLHMASAARASATFPYVTPFVKPSKTNVSSESLALGDGGYADNEGIVTAVDWLDFIARRAANASEEGSPVPFKRILLLRIQPNSDQPKPNSKGFDSNRIFANLRWLAGPFESLISMRSSSQVERGLLEIDLAANYIDQQWWGRVESDDSESSTQADSSDAIPNSQHEIYLREFQAQQSILKGEHRLERSGSQDLPEDNDDSPRPQGFSGEQLSDWKDLPVVVRTLPFVTDEEIGDQIPLNWKLSEKQKEWYPKVWKVLESQNNDKGESLFFKELDELFQQRKKAAK